MSSGGRSVPYVIGLYQTKICSRTKVDCGAFATIQQSYSYSNTVPDRKIVDGDQAYSRPRPIRISDHILGLVLSDYRKPISFPQFQPLEESYSRIDPSSSDCCYSHPKYLIGTATLLLLMSAGFLFYGVSNLYYGPCDWRSAASLVGGCVPFVSGLWLIFYVYGWI
jgi:hypothetical protein